MKSQASTKLFFTKQTVTELSLKQLSSINGGSITTIMTSQYDTSKSTSNESHSNNTASTLLCNP